MTSTAHVSRMFGIFRRASAEPPRWPSMDEPARRPSRPGEVTLDTVRSLIREKGLLWGRDALNRYEVKRFAAMNPKQLAALYAELAPAA